MLDSKDYKFMRFTIEGSKIFATCEKRKYMAIIVDKNGKIESTGYNGSPTGFKHCNEGCPRYLNQVPHGTPYDSGAGMCYAIHAEINCLLHSDVNARIGGTLYVNGEPCFGCAKALANSGIARLVYLDEKEIGRLDNEQVFDLLSQTSIEVLQIKKDDV